MPTYKKYIFIGLGSIFTMLGITGIFIPILPTTPFLVLAAYLFARSSQRCLNWLLTNRLFGTYISNYRSGKGLPLMQKILTLLLLWVTIGYSAFFVVDKLWLKILLGLIALGVTIHLVLIKTYKREYEDNPILNADVQSALSSKDD